MQHYYALDLKDDPELIAKYEAWHQPGQVPAHILAGIAASGIGRMQIFRTGNRLFMVTTVQEQSCGQSLSAADPASQDWEALMDTFQATLPWALPGQKWVPLSCIFDSTAHQSATFDESQPS